MNLDMFQEEVGTWGDHTFGRSTPQSVLAHLRDELDELTASLSPEEAADCLLLLLHFAHKRDFSLADEAKRKFAINLSRTWGEPDERGVVRHIVEDATLDARIAQLRRYGPQEAV